MLLVPPSMQVAKNLATSCLMRPEPLTLHALQELWLIDKSTPKLNSDGSDRPPLEASLRAPLGTQVATHPYKHASTVNAKPNVVRGVSEMMSHQI